jgi:hypothetical protein
MMHDAKKHIIIIITSIIIIAIIIVREDGIKFGRSKFSKIRRSPNLHSNFRGYANGSELICWQGSKFARDGNRDYHQCTLDDKWHLSVWQHSAAKLIQLNELPCELPSIANFVSRFTSPPGATLLRATPPRSKSSSAQ